MDVRCDRCQTEYELDDESVAGAGASVQCTTCGHTFVVTRAGSMTMTTTPPSGLGHTDVTAPSVRLPQTSPGMGGSTPPPVPEWVLATEEGQTHRLRDLTTLQKWVVERRVSRVDRVSYRGGAWRPLDDVEELRPFFEVVEQADRQTGAARPAELARSVRPTQPATPRKIQNPARPHMSPDLDDDDVLSNASSQGRRSRGDADRFSPDRFVDSDIGTDDDLSLALRPRRTGLKIFGAILIVGAAGVAWYVGFRDPHGFRLASGAPIPAPTPAPAASPPPAPAAATPAPASPPPVAPVAAAPATPAAVAPVAAASAAAMPAPAAAPAAPPAAPPSAAKPSAAAPTPAEASAVDATTKAAHAATTTPAEARPRSYEQLVAEGDRALENGQTVKAQKLYDEALRQQPGGVAAMTGSAYVLMDKRRSLGAIGLFKQALTRAPNFAPALFGLGEAYRSEGETAPAIDAYKRYLEQSPTGTDAPAARRQIKELGEVAATPRNQGPSAVVPEGARSEAPTAPPPAPTP